MFRGALADPTADTLPCVDVRRSSSCTSPLVGRRDPLGVGLRLGCVDWASPVKRHAANPRSPGRLPGGTRMVSGRTLLTCASGPSQARATVLGGYGPSAVPGPGPLLVVRNSFDRPANDIPVGDATALGTLRTRLETRTKESNMYASHWD